MNELTKDLNKIIGRDNVKTDPADLLSYESDATFYSARGKPDAIVLPRTVEDVSKILIYATASGIPVTPRGAGSGLSGGCTPIRGGIVMDMKRMNRILNIDNGNLTAQVECGVVLSDFHSAVEKQHLFYPPDPQSMRVCTIGGNVATRAGGPRGVKYGTTSNYVLGLEVVLADGSIIQTGSSCVKNSVGYDLPHLFTGAEGTLGVITKATLRLLPLPPAHRTVVVSCYSSNQAMELVSAIIAAGAVPAMLEYLSQAAIGLMNTYINPSLNGDGESYLLMELDGSLSQIEEEAKSIDFLCREMKVLDIRVIEDEKEAASYWEARSNMTGLLLTLFKKTTIEDVTVPRNRIPEFAKALQELSAKTGVMIGVAGHAGDGNMHPTILFPEVNKAAETAAQDAIRKIIKIGLSLGGTISGEHGIGLHKSEFLIDQLGSRQIELMKQIKQVMDPSGIMNPGKIWQSGGKSA